MQELRQKPEQRCQTEVEVALDLMQCHTLILWTISNGALKFLSRVFFHSTAFRLYPVPGIHAGMYFTKSTFKTSIKSIVREALLTDRECID